MYLWGRCDVPFGPSKTVPEKCIILDNYLCMNNTVFKQNLEAAVQDLKDGFGLVMIYHDSIDYVGHIHGPDADEVNEEMKRVDAILGHFFYLFYEAELEKTTSFIIVGDHGEHT